MDVLRVPGRQAGSLVGVLLLAFALLLPSPARAAAEEVDLQLVLAVDISRSMDADEQRLQRQGYVGAFLDPDVVGAIRSGMLGRMAVAYVEWAGADLHRVVVPWTLIDGAETAAAFSARLAAAPIDSWRRTSISSALLFSSALFEESGFASHRRVIDISGDGPNNAGPGVVSARDAVLEQGIVINGLPVMLKTESPSGFFDIAELDVYYEDCVIGGFGAFIVTVRHRAEFAAAIRRKLILEIAGAAPAVVPAQFARAEPRIDCFIGEMLWNRFMSWPE